MAQNMESSYGLYFSEHVLTALIDAGMTRQEAYKLVQRSAMQSWQNGEPFRAVLEGDPEIAERLTPYQLDEIFDTESFLRHIDTGFERLGLRRSEETVAESYVNAP